MKDFKNPILYFIPLALLTLSIIILPSLIIKEEKQDIRSKAQTSGKTIDVCESGCQFNGGEGIQQAVDSASDGDTILIKKGNYPRNGFTPFSEGQAISKVDKCFLNLHGKSLTLKGESSVLFGEGHDKAYAPGYGDRAGVCSVGGSITIDNLRIKEFQKRCLIFADTKLIIKNSIIEGCDEGGLTLLRNSQALIVNSFFVQVIGIMPSKESIVRAFNNIFYPAKGILLLYCGEPPSIYFANNIVGDSEIIVGFNRTCAEFIPKLKTSLSNNLFFNFEQQCRPEQAYCEDFPGKIYADPMFIEPVTDQRGMAAWANYGLKEGSPAIRAGSDGNNLGVEGGPCASGESPACASFIAQESVKLVPPASPTSAIPIIENPPPEQPPDSEKLLPTKKPYSKSDTDQPPITYYLPPTMSFTDPNNPPPNNSPSRPKDDQPLAETPPTPTITPTPKPLIDVAKAVENAKNTWNNLIILFLQFSKTILP